MAKRGNYRFFDKYTWYVPTVGGMFGMFGLFLLGSLLGALVSFLLGRIPGFGADYIMIIVYPLNFLPLLIYAANVSSRRSLNNEGYKLDSKKIERGGLLVALVTVATFALAFCIDPLVAVLPEMPEMLKEALKTATQGNFVANFICVSLFAPLFEEWMCRGLVLRGLLANKMKPVWAIVVSAAFFAVIHLNPWQAIPAFLIGCLMGYVYYKTGSLKLTMLIHFVNNTASLIISNIDKYKDLETWADVLPATQYWLLFAAFALAIILVIRAFAKIPNRSSIGNIDSVPSLFEAE